MKRTPLIGLTMLTGCAPDPPENPWTAEEEALIDAHASARLTVEGRVVDGNGDVITGAQVSLGDQETTTDASGRFSFSSVARRNELLLVEASGHRGHVQPVQLFVPLAQSSVDVPVVSLASEEGTRFLWTGDFMIGRRFLDTNELAGRDELPTDDPDALVMVSDPEAGSLQAVAFVRELFDAADFPIPNLESVVTDDPQTPHATKDYVYFTLPESLVALTSLGVEYVNLGNNHVFDYLDQGMVDTFDWLDSAGLAHSGAGDGIEAAMAPWRVTLDGQTYSLFGANSITGDEHPVSYVAEDGKGGAASLKDIDVLIRLIEEEVAAGNIPLVQIHSGYEYTYFPSSYTRSVYEAVAEAGAGLVVGNHTHVAQGVGWTDGGALALHCLGNFVFDQTRADTMLGELAEVQQDGLDVFRAQMIPVYLEDFRPRLISGALSAQFLRRMSASSDASTPLAMHGDRLWILDDEDAVSLQSRTVEMSVTVPSGGELVVDLRDWAAPTESLSALAIPGADSVQIGRDLLYFGTFEDEDVDDDEREAARWDVEGDSREICFLGARSGNLGLCMYRNEGNVDDSVTAYRNRIRVWGDGLHEPNKDVTLFGHVRGIDAGAVSVRVEYSASVGEAVFGDETFALSAGGTFDWTAFTHDLTIPPDTDDPEDELNNPRALRFFLSQTPTEVGWGQVAFDDLAVVSWDEMLDPAGATLSFPHPRDFLRIQAQPGEYTLFVTFAEAQPAVLDGL